MLRHTNPFIQRSLAFMLAMLFCIVRMAAAWHTHETAHSKHSVGNEIPAAVHSIGLFADKESLPPNTSQNDDCPLCHLFSQGIAEILPFALVFATALVLVFKFFALPSFPIHRFISRLSDRAPPRFA